jgi:hypothetical protein
MAPQITVTIDADIYMDIIHNLPKGMKSRFVNMACRRALSNCEHNGKLMHIYARKGPRAMMQVWADMNDKVGEEE